MVDKVLPDWVQIVEMHAHRVFQVAMRVLGSVHDAEDISQDVFIEAFRIYQEGQVNTWTGLLVRLATLRSIDHLRRTRHAAELHEADCISEDDPFQKAVATELSEWLRQRLAGLPEQQAAVFVMHYFEQLPREEIATALEISTGSVSTALYKSRQRLLAQLAAFNRGNVK